MSVLVREHMRLDEGMLSQQDSAVRDDVRSSIAQLSLLMPEDNVSEQKKKDNAIGLSSGEFGGFSLSKLDTYVQAVSPGCSVNRKVSIDNDAVVENVTFVNVDPDHTGVLVEVGSTATVMFRNCVFSRVGSDQVSSLVAFKSGGKGIMVGCLFKGTVQGTTNVVSNPGAAANVQVVASHNKTGGSLAQVTSTAVL